MTAPSPRDTFITIYGRKPVLEALADPSVTIDKVLLATGAREASAQAILEAAAARGVRLERLPPDRITRISRNGRHDQGVVADVIAPRMRTLPDWLDELGDAPAQLFVLDGVTNPSNVGMTIRTATAAGIDGVVLPRQGVPEVGPLVIKASAGIAYRASILRVAAVTDALGLLAEAGFMIFGLAEEQGEPYFDVDTPERSAFVLGGETYGVSPEASEWIHQWLHIPMAGGVDSLNVATASAALAFELVRRAHAG